MPEQATLILRLDAPLQAWGTGAKWRIRHTNPEPSFSGVVGILCAALGWTRDHPLDDFQPLQMAVRADREGRIIHDYHTVGAPGRPPLPERFQGSLTAGGKIKHTASTGEIETLLSERYYLADAVFTVALGGPRPILEACLAALRQPRFPLYLGRKSCPPGMPLLNPGQVLLDAVTPEDALRQYPWQGQSDPRHAAPPRLRMLVPARPGDPGAEPRPDVPRSFAARDFSVRFVRTVHVDTAELAPLGAIPARHHAPGRLNNYPDRQSPAWQRKREERLRRDGYRCVFTGLPAEEVHHITYANANHEDVEMDLRALGRLAHDAITMLEAQDGLRRERLDPRPAAPDERHAAFEQRLRDKMADIIAQRDLAALEHLRKRLKSAQPAGGNRP